MFHPSIQYKADRLVGTVKAHAQIREYEAGIGNDVVCVFDGLSSNSIEPSNLDSISSPAGLDTEAVAYLARSEIASSLRSRQPIQLCLLVGGMVRCNNPVVTTSDVKNTLSFSERVQQQVLAGSDLYATKKSTKELKVNEPQGNAETSHRAPPTQQTIGNPFLMPRLYWLDQYGSIQNLKYGAHGFGSNFALSVLDQRFRSNLSRKEAMELIRECFEQLRQRYVINSPLPPRIKCIDAFGVKELLNE